MTNHKQGADASAAVQKFGPPVPQSALACIQEYGDARADGNEMSGTLLCRTIIELRRWAANVAALAAAAPADAGESRVPAGFKLVPVNATLEMRAAFHAVSDSDILLHGAAGSRWAAMLAAAPEAPTAPLPAAEEVDPWRTIETAPKDGTTVLLAAPGRVTAGEWHAEQWPTASEYHGSTGEYLGQHETGECIPAAWYSWDGGFTDENPPTHWKPMPSAPTTLPPGEPKP